MNRADIVAQLIALEKDMVRLQLRVRELQLLIMSSLDTDDNDSVD